VAAARHWPWVRSDYNDGSTVVVGDPNRYTMSFRADGTLGIRADCNQVIGSYTQQADGVALRLGPTTY
jgi:heat shock protein HslJ